VTVVNRVVEDFLAGRIPWQDMQSELAKSPTPETPVFTNCGKVEPQEVPVKPAKKLTRVPFTVSRLMEFCSKRELETQTGHYEDEWPLVVLKELVDNALDAAEEAEIAPVISIAVKGNSITVTDNGPGIPATTIDGVLDYSVKVSSREAYVSPTRGAQGNALKTLLPMGYVLDDRHGEQATGKTMIEANGVSHQIIFGVDHIKQEPKIEHTMKPSAVARGTKITVNLPPGLREGRDGMILVSRVEYSKNPFLRLAESYAWLNPHLSLRVTWNGERVIDIKASNPTWQKWLPTWPTCAHWYDASRFRRYMAAHIAYRGNITVREFISEFRGMAGTAKQKQVLAATGASHVSLHNFFGLHKANTDNIKKLLAALKMHTKPVSPADLGIIGKEHLFHRMEERPSPHHRMCIQHSSRRAWCWERTTQQDHHRRELVARHQQSVPATWPQRRRTRRGIGGTPSWHLAAGDHRTASGVPAHRLYGQR
jgi:hypothetical protein